ncbi:MAG: phage tail tube protein [Clostridium fessum]
MELKVTERKLLGHRMSQHKVVGATGSGSGTFYFMNSDALKDFVNYKKTGEVYRIYNAIYK